VDEIKKNVVWFLA